MTNTHERTHRLMDRSAAGLAGPPAHAVAQDSQVTDWSAQHLFPHEVTHANHRTKRQNARVRNEIYPEIITLFLSDDVFFELLCCIFNNKQIRRSSFDNLPI